MSKQLKISADTSEIKRSLLDLSRTVKTQLGQSKIKLFSSDSEKMIKKEAKEALKDIEKTSSSINDLIKKQADVVKEATRGTAKHAEETKKLLELHKQLAEVQSGKGQLQGLAKNGMNFTPGGMGGGSPLGMLGKLGGLAKFMAPVGMLGYGVSRGMSFANRFDEAVPNRIKLRGRGVNDFNLTGEQRQQASAYGLDRNELEKRRLEGMDIYGRKGSSTQSVLERARFERGFGLQSGAMNQFGSQFRGVMGGARSSEAVSKLQASLMASGVEDAIGPYLETAANTLMSINKNGLSNQTEILAAFADLTKKTGEAPELIGRDLQTVDSTIRNSTGERNAFAQTAFARAGIGGGTIGGTQAALRSGGLFGADLSQLPAAQRKQLESIGMGTTGFKERSGALLKEFTNLGFNVGPKASSQDLVTAGRGAMGFFGAQNEVEGLRIVNLLQKAQEGDRGAVSQLKEMQKDPQIKNLENIYKSSEGQLDQLKAIRRTIESELGEKLTPVTIASRNALKNIDELIGLLIPPIGAVAKGITNLLGFFGVGTDEKEAEMTAQLKNPESFNGLDKVLEEDKKASFFDRFNPFSSSSKEEDNLLKTLKNEQPSNMVNKSDIASIKSLNNKETTSTPIQKDSNSQYSNEEVLNVLRSINNNLVAGNRTRDNISKSASRPRQSTQNLDSTLGD